MMLSKAQRFPIEERSDLKCCSPIDFHEKLAGVSLELDYASDSGEIQLWLQLMKALNSAKPQERDILK
jgi:hypothetical protein